MNISLNNYNNYFIPQSSGCRKSQQKNIPEKQDSAQLISFKNIESTKTKALTQSFSTEEVADILLNAIEVKDLYTANHSKAVSLYSEALAQKYAKKRRMKNPKVFVEKVKLAAKLHDIGKFSFPHSVLKRNVHLQKQEALFIKRHPLYANKILASNPKLTGIAKVCLYHHENWDGSGYPFGIKGKEIPVESRIIAVCDTFDAMTSKRFYQNELNCEEACKKINDKKGKQFDPELTDLFLAIAPELCPRVQAEVYKKA